MGGEFVCRWISLCNDQSFSTKIRLEKSSSEKCLPRDSERILTAGIFAFRQLAFVDLLPTVAT